MPRALPRSSTPMGGREPRASLTISISDLRKLDGGIQQHLAAALGLALVPAERRQRVRCVSGVRGCEGDAGCPYSCRVLKRRWQISLMAPSSLVSCDTSRSSSPTASSSSSTDSKSAPLPCRIPVGTRRRRYTPRRCRDRWHAPASPIPPLPGRLPPQREGVATCGAAGGRATAGRREPLTRHVSEELAVQVGELGAEDVGAGRHGGAGPPRGAAAAARSRKGRRALPGRRRAAAMARGPPGYVVRARLRLCITGPGVAIPAPRAGTAAPGAIGAAGTGPKPAQPLLVLSPRERGFGRIWGFYPSSFKN